MVDFQLQDLPHFIVLGSITLQDSFLYLVGNSEVVDFGLSFSEGSLQAIDLDFMGASGRNETFFFRAV